MSNIPERLAWLVFDLNHNNIGDNQTAVCFGSELEAFNYIDGQEKLNRDLKFTKPELWIKPNVRNRTLL